MWRILTIGAALAVPAVAVTSVTAHNVDQIVFAPPPSDVTFPAATVTATPERIPVQHTVAATIEYTTTTIPTWTGPLPDYYGGGTNCTIEEATIVADRMRNVGATNDSIIWMLTVMSRESGCDPSAHNGNRNTGDDSWGLCQLNVLAGFFDPDGILARFDRHQFANNFGLNVDACITLWTVCGRGPWTKPYWCNPPNEL